MNTFDVDRVRQDFPALQQEIHGRPLVYLDNAATTQKPRTVIDRLVTFYSTENANVHRGAHTLSRRATEAYEAARETVRRHVGAEHPDEIVFTGGATDSINLVAATFGRSVVSDGDEILISTLEHHSNIVPWQMLCERVGARLIVIPVSDAGEIDVDAALGLMNERTSLFAVSHASNALGTINPIETLAREARERGIPVLIDGAQGIPHLSVDVRAIGCDFYCFSGHKACGPTGIGVLYARRDRLAGMPPFKGGGEMIRSVSFERSTFAEPPFRFEAGTPNIAGAVGLAEALSYLDRLGKPAIETYERDLADYALQALGEVDGLRIVGTASRRVPVLSFVVDGVHPLDLGTMLDTRGIAVRTGQHCTEPLMHRLGISGTLRASLAFYNTRDEVDRLARELMNLIPVLR